MTDSERASVRAEAFREAMECVARIPLIAITTDGSKSWIGRATALNAIEHLACQSAGEWPQAGDTWLLDGAEVTLISRERSGWVIKWIGGERGYAFDDDADWKAATFVRRAPAEPEAVPPGFREYRLGTGPAPEPPSGEAVCDDVKRAAFELNAGPPGSISLHDAETCNERGCPWHGVAATPPASVAAVETGEAGFQVQPLHTDRKAWTCRCRYRKLPHAAADEVCLQCGDTPPWPPKAFEDKWNAALAAPPPPQSARERAHKLLDWLVTPVCDDAHDDGPDQRECDRITAELQRLDAALAEAAREREAVQSACDSRTRERHELRSDRDTWRAKAEALQGDRDKYKEGALGWLDKASENGAALIAARKLTEERTGLLAEACAMLDECHVSVCKCSTCEFLCRPEVAAIAGTKP